MGYLAQHGCFVGLASKRAACKNYIAFPTGPRQNTQIEIVAQG